MLPSWQTDSSYKRAGYFVIFMVTFHMILKGLLPSMEEVESQVCLHAWYNELHTKEGCIQQRGQFGDQRLFYPFVTGVVTVYLFRRERLRIAMKVVTQPRVRQV